MKFKPYPLAALLVWGVLALAPTTAANAAPLAPTANHGDWAARVSGRVTDESGEGLAGVSIKVKGTATGTSTDINGDFSLEAPAGSTLVVSYTGYETQEVGIGNQTAGINIALRPAANTLADVVVIGYGSVRKSDLTASVSTVKAEELKAFPTTSVDQALTARATGVNVTQASGAPGGAVTVRVRGSNSIKAGTEPLYVVDGIPIYSDNDAYSAGGNRTASNALSGINPSDIESVEILKDASGTAIYGSRGSNGVVLITTKRGKAGVTRVNYEGTQGFASATNTIEMMNAGEFMQFQNARARSRNQTEPYSASAISAAGEGVNWLDETTRVGGIMNHNLSFSGGTDKVTFAIMPGYFRNEGIIKGTDFDRYSLRANIEAKFLNDRLRIGTNSMFSRTSLNNVPTDRGGPGGAIITILGQNPIGPVYNEDGSYHLEPYDGRFLTNPLAEVTEVVDRDKTNRYLANNYVALEIAKGLSFRSSFGFDLFGSGRETYYNLDTRLGRERGRSYELAQRNVVNFLNENILTYSKEMANSRFDVLAGYSYQTDNNRVFGAAANGYTFDDLDINRLQNGVRLLTPYSGRTEWVLKSYIGRVNYTLMDKYLFTVNFRRDGSSKFGPDNKWANFPSVAFAWRAKQESFLSGVDVLSDLKFRVSYGITGNSQIPIGNSLAELSGNKNYIVDNTIVAGVAETRVANPGLKWETTKMFDIGVDFGLLNGKLNFTVDYFKNRTSDLLLDVALPTSTGFTSALQNSGELENTGLEASVNAVAVNTKNFRWNLGLNVSSLQNKIVSLAGTPPFYSYIGSHLGNDGSYVAEGLPIGGWYGLEAIGIWQSAEEIAANPSLVGIDKPGYVRYKDANGDGTINNSDRVFLGDPNPDIIWGLNSTMSFKGLDLNIFVRGAHGQKIRNLQASEHADGVGNYNQYKVVATDSWSETNKGGTRPIVDGTREFASYFRRSSFFIEDGSFVRIQNISLGYTLPKISGVRSLRVYVSGQNVGLFTKYTGWDPEVSNSGQSALNRGDDYDTYPRAKTYTLGVQLGL